MALVDWLALLASLVAGLFLLRGWKSFPSTTLQHTLAGAVLLTLFNSLSNALQWTGISAAFDPFEDYVQLLIPILYGLAVYDLLRRRAENDLQNFAEQLRQERDLVQSITQTSPAGIMLLDPQGLITYVNRQAEQVLGRSSAELLGDRCTAEEWGIVGPDGELIPQELLPYAQVARTHQPLYGVRCSILRPDQQQVHLAVNAAPLFAPGGELQGVIMTFEDITQRLHAEQALRESERRLRELIEKSNDMIILTDEAGAIIEWNPSASATTGLPREQVLGRPIWEVQLDLATPEQRQQINPELPKKLAQEALTTGQSPWLGRLTESTIQRRDGAQRSLQSIQFVIPTGQGYRLASVMRDMTDYQQARTALLRSERNYRQIFNASSDAILILEPHTGEILDANQAALDLFGHSYGEILRLSLAHLTANPARDARRLAERWLQDTLQHGPQRMEWLALNHSGESFWTEVALSAVELDGQPRVQAAIRDISQRKQMEQALFDEKERAQVTLHSIGDAVITTDAQLRVEYLNPMAQALTGWTLEEARGRALAEVFRLVDEQTREPAPDPVARCLQEGRLVSMSGHSVLISRSGKEYDIADTAAPIRAADGQIHGAVLVFHDVSEARRLERQMAHDAAHDTLTGLVNRREFEVRVERALLSAKERGANHVLCYMDLDQFKLINDTAGHAAGDQVLKQVANLLSGLFRQRDTLARLGGDEFGLLLENCPLERGVNIAGEIVSHVQRMPFEWQGRIYHLGVSIGIVPIDSQTESLAQALSQADVACYTAKDLGRGRVHVYQGQGNESARMHSEILRAAKLHEALEWEQFQLYCQPILPLQAAEPQARWELFLRLQDEDGQLLPPAAFIPSAERYGMMAAIDRWVIQTAFRRYTVHFSGMAGPHIALNLSSSSLSDDTLLDFIYAQFRLHPVPPERVCFEITETAAIHNLNQAQRFAGEISRLGGRIALDDFGSGFSSFRYLKDLPVSFIKIEGSFVRHMLTSAGDRVMVAAINQVGHTLGIQTIAEHVAEAAILDALRQMGVDYAQGYGVGPPVPLAQAWGNPN